MEITVSKVKAKSLTQQELVDLLCTAITDYSQYLYLHNPKRHYDKPAREPTVSIVG